MSRHSNKAIVKHVEDSATLLDKMHVLTQKLNDRLQQDFERNMGVPLPSVVLAQVRQIDITMFYATDASVDEYVLGAKSLLESALGQQSGLAFRALDFVGVVARKIIGTGDIKIGVHSTGGRVEDLTVACLSVVERAKASDWLTQSDFFVCAYALVVWKAAPSKLTLMAAAPVLQAHQKMAATMAPERAAEATYRFSPL